MDLEVLVATMGQTDCSLAEKMNITVPAVLANQCGKWSYDSIIDVNYEENVPQIFHIENIMHHYLNGERIASEDYEKIFQNYTRRKSRLPL